MSPEYLQWGEITLEDDLWSFGVLFWELVAKGTFPALISWTTCFQHLLVYLT